MAEMTSSPPHRRSPSVKKQIPERAARPLRILLAEDNKVNQQYASVILASAGHSVELAANGRLAVDALGRSDFDVVLMDIQMPELDGVEATRQIRALPGPKGRVPIIAVTAYAMAGAREEYLAAGMDDYISKPFQPASLLGAVAKISDCNAEPSQAVALASPGGEADFEKIEDLPVLDLEQLHTLESVFSPAKIKTLASLYMIDVEARLALIQEFRANADFDGISRQAHMIVSTAANLGAKQSSALAHALEVSCLSRDDARSDRLIAEVRASCELSSATLKRLVTGDSSPRTVLTS
jgi:CheY-like chemotaxis protein